MSDTPTRFALRHDAPNDIPAAEALWPEGVPGFEPDGDNQEQSAERGEEIFCRFISNIRVPSFQAFPAKAENNTGAAVIVCPGGGYSGVAIDHEGYDLARYFNAQGISAFVLKYRMPAPDGRHGLWRDAPLADALRLIRIVRSRATQYGIDPNRVGIMGFSSGGHLAMLASNRYDKLPETDVTLAAQNPRPDFTSLIYPVISLYEGYCHLGSRHNLLGVAPTREMMKEYSGEYIVTEKTPKTFLALTEDDMVYPENSLRYFKACMEHHVPAEMHIFPEGGHGYGMRVRDLGIDSWPDLLSAWIKRYV